MKITSGGAETGVYAVDRVEFGDGDVWLARVHVVFDRQQRTRYYSSIQNERWQYAKTTSATERHQTTSATARQVALAAIVRFRKHGFL